MKPTKENPLMVNLIVDEAQADLTVTAVEDQLLRLAFDAASMDSETPAGRAAQKRLKATMDLFATLTAQTAGRAAA